MWKKAVLAGTTALALAGSSLVYAQQQSGPANGPRHWRPSAEDISAFTDARIAALKAGLKLTPDQEKNWPAVETAIRDLAKQRSERFAARASAPRSDDLIARLNNRAEAMTQRAASVKKLADASAPLYQGLDEGQKHRFAMLLRVGMRNHMRGGFEHHRGMMRGGEGGPRQ
ncbi:MAG TPA: Spy/CpxP family protein refolding chaperone [Pseudolabrys sp.]|nr:Spy/CpxP family protein refolding chaperone [Pseudolabrys sp.]